MSFSQARSNSVQFEQALAPFLNEPGLPFAQVLPAGEVACAFEEAGVDFGASKRSVFTPALTVWAWLSQVVDPAKSCSAAVLRISALLVALAQEPVLKTPLPIAAPAAKYRRSSFASWRSRLVGALRKRRPKTGCGRSGTRNWSMVQR